MKILKTFFQIFASFCASELHVGNYAFSLFDFVTENFFEKYLKAFFYVSIYYMKKTQKTQKKRKTDREKVVYTCKFCDYTSSNKSDYKRHLKTRKHKTRVLEGNGILEKTHLINLTPEPKKFICNCGREFKSKSGLWKHNKKCDFFEQSGVFSVSKVSKKVSKDFQKFPNDTEEDIDKKLKQIQLENELLKQQKLKKEIEQMDKNVQNPKNGPQGCANYVQFGDGGNQTYNNNNISINMYLNENCKNAMSLEDFMQNIKISLQDLDYTTKNGYMAGISNILMNQLCDIAPNERPIHCSDQKRLQFYVKEDDTWKKDQNNQKINSSINKIKIKQYDTIDKWMEENPNWQSDPELVDEYQHMVDKIAGPSEQKEKMRLSKKIQKELAKATNIKDEIQKMKNK